MKVFFYSFLFYMFFVMGLVFPFVFKEKLEIDIVSFLVGILAAIFGILIYKRIL